MPVLKFLSDIFYFLGAVSYLCYHISKPGSKAISELLMIVGGQNKGLKGMLKPRSVLFLQRKGLWNVLLSGTLSVA